MGRSLRVALLAIGSALVVLLVGTGILQVAQSAQAAASGDDSGVYDVAEPFTALELEVDAAELTVSYADVDEARFDFDSGGSSLRFDQRMHGDTLRVSVGDRGWWPVHLFDLGDLSRLGSASLRVTLPRDLQPLALDVDSSAGAVRVDGDFTRVEIGSSAGSIDLAGSAESVSLESSAGSITARSLDVSGPVETESSAGGTDLEFASLPSAISVESSAGNVRVALPDGEYELRTDTSFGTVAQGLRSTPGADRRYTFETSAGDLTLVPAR
jgi:hypothetical protein